MIGAGLLEHFRCLILITHLNAYQHNLWNKQFYEKNITYAEMV